MGQGLQQEIGNHQKEGGTHNPEIGRSEPRKLADDPQHRIHEEADDLEPNEKHILGDSVPSQGDDRALQDG